MVPALPLRKAWPEQSQPSLCASAPRPGAAAAPPAGFCPGPESSTAHLHREPRPLPRHCPQHCPHLPAQARLCSTVLRAERSLLGKPPEVTCVLQWRFHVESCSESLSLPRKVTCLQLWSQFFQCLGPRTHRCAGRGGRNFSPVPATLLVVARPRKRQKQNGTREAAPGQLSRTALGWEDKEDWPGLPCGNRSRYKRWRDRLPAPSVGLLLLPWNT